MMDASPHASMREKKISKLRPHLNMQSRKYYQFLEDSSSQILFLLRSFTELFDLHSLDNISRSVVTFTSSGMEEVDNAFGGWLLDGLVVVLTCSMETLEFLEFFSLGQVSSSFPGQGQKYYDK